MLELMRLPRAIVSFALVTVVGAALLLGAALLSAVTALEREREGLRNELAGLASVQIAERASDELVSGRESARLLSAASALGGQPSVIAAASQMDSEVPPTSLSSSEETRKVGVRVPRGGCRLDGNSLATCSHPMPDWAGLAVEHGIRTSVDTSSAYSKGTNRSEAFAVNSALTGSYAGIRKWLATVLEMTPDSLLVSARFRRQSPAGSDVSAEIRFGLDDGGASK